MMISFLSPLLLIILSAILFSIHSYPMIVSSNLENLSSSQIDHLCSYISNIETIDFSPEKRFAVPFPDMNRFLSTSPKLHRHHQQHHHESQLKSGSEIGTTKHDFHAYLCSLSKDSEEMSNFINIFIEEHGQPPAFNLFESCEQVAKRDDYDELSSAFRQVCSSRVVKRWSNSIEGPIAIDFINQMLEARKVKSYPYSAEMDPYLV
ncbi:hypothetical protein I4U23_012367 [Adineta vaga]|nr:hypothetical protein I4U23_012367 [Adineta vaga]